MLAQRSRTGKRRVHSIQESILQIYIDFSFAFDILPSAISISSSAAVRYVEAVYYSCHYSPKISMYSLLRFKFAYLWVWVDLRGWRGIHPHDCVIVRERRKVRNMLKHDPTGKRSICGSELWRTVSLKIDTSRDTLSSTYRHHGTQYLATLGERSSIPRVLYYLKAP
jgi:hypothetical protein